MEQLTLKKVVKECLPPIALILWQRFRKNGTTYSGIYPSWQEAIANSTGYDSDIILDTVASALEKVKLDEAVYERDSVLFDEIQHSFPLLAGLLLVAANNQGSLSVLDFGGSLGSTYFQCRNFLSLLPQVRWSIVEQEKFVQRGRELFETEQLRFFYTLDESIQSARPNVALFSSVLQYIQSPYDIIRLLTNANVQYVIVDRTPFTSKKKDQLCVQHVSPKIYQASYPCWIFSESNFKCFFLKEFELITDFESQDGDGYINKIPFSFKGMIWKRRLI